MNAALVATLLRGSLSSNRWRSLLAIVCIALGVALAGAVNTLHASALDEIDRAARLLAGTADYQVKGPRNGFDDAAYAPVALHPAVAVASPVIELDAPLPGGTGAVRVMGIDPFRAARLQPGFLAEGSASRGEETPTLLDANAAWLTPAALARFGAKVGDEVVLGGPKGEVRLKVAGALPALDGGGPLVVMDIAAVQLYFDRIGVIHRIDLRLEPDAPREAALRAIAALLPPGVALTRPDEAAMRTAGLTQAYRVNLTALALMALFTGGFLVFSTLALQAARRRQEFALLRALGLTAGGVRAFLALEGGLLGLAGAVAGTVLGLAASRAMLERFGYDLGAGFFSGTGNTFAPDASSLAIIGVLGVLTAAAAALAVTRPLASLDVAQALKDRHLDLPSPPGGWSWPLGLAAGAVVAAFLPPAGEISVGGYLSIGLALAAAVMAVSPASRFLLDRVPASDAPLRTLARAQVKSLPGHLSAMVSGIVVSVALTAAMAIMVHSFRVSLDGWLTGVLEADLFARAAPQGDAVVFSKDAQARMAAVPGVARIDPIRFERLTPEGSTGLLTVIARPIDAQLLRGFQADPPVVPPRNGPLAAWISEAAVDLFGWKPGQEITRAAGREPRHLPHRRHLPRLLAHLGRDPRGPGGLPRAHERHARQRHRHPPRARRGRRRRVRGRPRQDRGAGARRGTARRELHPRPRARHLRPHLRRHLRAGGRGDPDRAGGRHLQLRGAGVVAAARVRRAAPPGALARRGAAGCWPSKGVPPGSSARSSGCCRARR